MRQRGRILVAVESTLLHMMLRRCQIKRNFQKTFALAFGTLDIAYVVYVNVAVFARLHKKNVKSIDSFRHKNDRLTTLHSSHMMATIQRLMSYDPA
jgi:hypothetical protein